MVSSESSNLGSCLNAQIQYDLTETDKAGNARFAVAMAGIAYMSQAEAETTLARVGYRDTKVLFFRTSLVTATIVQWDDVLVIAFKGSKTWREWLNNFNIWPKKTSDGFVFSGWANSIEKFGPALIRIIYPGLLSGSKIVLTGHSRGGALALNFRYILALNGFAPAACYTFGAPPVGEPKYVYLLHGLLEPPELPWWLQFQLTFYVACIAHSLRVFGTALIKSLIRYVVYKLRKVFDLQNQSTM